MWSEIKKTISKRYFSCEGCKCFFRRSANGANVRPCKHEGLCEISIKTRGKCQGCRYAKCIGVGMIPGQNFTSKLKSKRLNFIYFYDLIIMFYVADESPTKRRRSYSTPKVCKCCQLVLFINKITSILMIIFVKHFTLSDFDLQMPVTFCWSSHNKNQKLSPVL